MIEDARSEARADGVYLTSPYSYIDKLIFETQDLDAEEIVKSVTFVIRGLVAAVSHHFSNKQKLVSSIKSSGKQALKLLKGMKEGAALSSATLQELERQLLYMVNKISPFIASDSTTPQESHVSLKSFAVYLCRYLKSIQAQIACSGTHPDKEENEKPEDISLLAVTSSKNALSAVANSLLFLAESEDCSDMNVRCALERYAVAIGKFAGIVDNIQSKNAKRVTTDVIVACLDEALAFVDGLAIDSIMMDNPNAGNLELLRRDLLFPAHQLALRQLQGNAYKRTDRLELRTDLARLNLLQSAGAMLAMDELLDSQCPKLKQSSFRTLRENVDCALENFSALEAVFESAFKNLEDVGIEALNSNSEQIETRKEFVNFSRELMSILDISDSEKLPNRFAGLAQKAFVSFWEGASLALIPGSSVEKSVHDTPHGTGSKIQSFFNSTIAPKVDHTLSRQDEEEAQIAVCPDVGGATYLLNIDARQRNRGDIFYKTIKTYFSPSAWNVTLPTQQQNLQQHNLSVVSQEASWDTQLSQKALVTPRSGDASPCSAIVEHFVAPSATEVGTTLKHATVSQQVLNVGAVNITSIYQPAAEITPESLTCSPDQGSLEGASLDAHANVSIDANETNAGCTLIEGQVSAVTQSCSSFTPAQESPCENTGKSGSDTFVAAQTQGSKTSEEKISLQTTADPLKKVSSAGPSTDGSCATSTKYGMSDTDTTPVNTEVFSSGTNEGTTCDGDNDSTATLSSSASETSSSRVEQPAAYPNNVSAPAINKGTPAGNGDTATTRCTVAPSCCTPSVANSTGTVENTPVKRETVTGPAVATTSHSPNATDPTKSGSTSNGEPAAVDHGLQSNPSGSSSSDDGKGASQDRSCISVSRGTTEYSTHQSASSELQTSGSSVAQASNLSSATAQPSTSLIATIDTQSAATSCSNNPKAGGTQDHDIQHEQDAIKSSSNSKKSKRGAWLKGCLGGKSVPAEDHDFYAKTGSETTNSTVLCHIYGKKRILCLGRKVKMSTGETQEDLHRDIKQNDSKIPCYYSSVHRLIYESRRRDSLFIEQKIEDVVPVLNSLSRSEVFDTQNHGIISGALKRLSDLSVLSGSVYTSPLVEEVLLNSVVSLPQCIPNEETGKDNELIRRVLTCIVALSLCIKSINAARTIPTQSSSTQSSEVAHVESCRSALSAVINACLTIAGHGDKTAKGVNIDGAALKRRAVCIAALAGILSDTQSQEHRRAIERALLEQIETAKTMMSEKSNGSIGALNNIVDQELAQYTCDYATRTLSTHGPRAPGHSTYKYPLFQTICHIRGLKEQKGAERKYAKFRKCVSNILEGLLKLDAHVEKFCLKKENGDKKKMSKAAKALTQAVKSLEDLFVKLERKLDKHTMSNSLFAHLARKAIDAWHRLTEQISLLSQSDHSDVAASSGQAQSAGRPANQNVKTQQPGPAGTLSGASTTTGCAVAMVGEQHTKNVHSIVSSL